MRVGAGTSVLVFGAEGFAVSEANPPSRIAGIFVTVPACLLSAPVVPNLGRFIVATRMIALMPFLVSPDNHAHGRTPAVKTSASRRQRP